MGIFGVPGDILGPILGSRREIWGISEVILVEFRHPEGILEVFEGPGCDSGGFKGEFWCFGADFWGNFGGFWGSRALTECRRFPPRPGHAPTPPLPAVNPAHASSHWSIRPKLRPRPSVAPLIRSAHCGPARAGPASCSAHCGPAGPLPVSMATGGFGGIFGVPGDFWGPQGSWGAP